MRIVSVQELAQHNTEQDAWVGLYGNVYDVTRWSPKHPGGQHVLRQLAGREGTNLFESYHKSTTRNVLGTELVPLIGKLEGIELAQYSPTSFYQGMRDI
jgi:cytochrome b involved in lipid metabolism